jgi:hypothetical protein
MTRSNSESAPDPRVVAELREVLWQTIPLWDKLLHLARDFCTDDVAVVPLCAICPAREECSRPCEQLKALLPNVYTGRPRRENLTGFHDTNLTEAQKTRRLDVFAEYEACKEIFSDKQWAVVSLYYRAGETQQEISRRLGKAVSTISEHLAKAKQLKEENDRRLRDEYREYLRRKTPQEP